MRTENRIDYVEIPVTDMAKAREFFSAMFGWKFQEWGADYMSFNDGHLAGGFRRAEEPPSAESVLLVFYSPDLERDVERVTELGATISADIFPFPGGRRFHFVDPTGNQYAIWSERLEPNSGE